MLAHRIKQAAKATSLPLALVYRRYTVQVIAGIQRDEKSPMVFVATVNQIETKEEGKAKTFSLPTELIEGMPDYGLFLSPNGLLAREGMSWAVQLEELGGDHPLFGFLQNFPKIEAPIAYEVKDIIARGHIRQKRIDPSEWFVGLTVAPSGLRLLRHIKKSTDESIQINEKVRGQTEAYPPRKFKPYEVFFDLGWFVHGFGFGPVKKLIFSTKNKLAPMVMSGHDFHVYLAPCKL